MHEEMNEEEALNRAIAESMGGGQASNMAVHGTGVIASSNLTETEDEILR